MKILQIIHDFFPFHVAGVEVYTDHLTSRLARAHEVALLYSEVIHDAPNYSLRRGRHGSVRTYEIVNNYHLNDFRETYDNPAIDRRVVEVIDEFRPDVVHIQHLINLSVGLVAELKRRGIPMVMTLHDHWLACANGGQRFDSNSLTCDTLRARACGDCTAHMHGIGLGARGLLRRAARKRADAGSSVPLTGIEPSAVQAADPSCVYRDHYEADGRSQPTWVAHPPARLAFEIELEGRGNLSTAVGMHPDTFEADGGAVRFEIAVNGEVLTGVTLDPKRKHEDRTPRQLQLTLQPGRLRIELRTESVPAGRGEYCTAGWISPHIDVGAGTVRLAESSALRFASKVVRLGARLAGRRQTRRIRTRWQTMRELGSQIDLFLAPSHYLADTMVEFGLPRERVLYCDYGFPSERFARRQSLPMVARRFAFIGSLVRHKGAHVLIDAFRHLPEDARLDIWGSPDYDPVYFESLLRRARHPGIHFRGGLDPTDVPGVLRTVDAQIVPSIWNENSPLTIHEASMTGIPVVASRMGGHVELLESGGGLLYDANDSDDLAAQLRRLYEEPGLVQKIGASTPPVKTMETHCKELLKIYSSLVATSADAHRGALGR